MTKRQIEIFVAGCSLCDETVRLVQELTCPNCEVSVYNLQRDKGSPSYLEKAQQYRVNAVPAIAINGSFLLADKPAREQL